MHTIYNIIYIRCDFYYISIHIYTHYQKVIFSEMHQSQESRIHAIQGKMELYGNA